MTNKMWMRRLGSTAKRITKLFTPHEKRERSRHLNVLQTTWGAQSTSGGSPRADDTVTDVIVAYLASQSFQDLSVKTRKLYELYLRQIGEKFGPLPIRVFDERGARTAIRKWRDDSLSSRPRTADATIAMLRLLLNFAVEEEYVFRNPAAGLGRIHTTTRRDIIWSDSQISSFLAKAPRHLARTMLLALWTGQRQSDLLALRWDSYDGKYIRLQQRKAHRGTTGRRVKILVSGELREILGEIEREQLARAAHADPRKRVPRPDTILATARGHTWQKGFKAAWRKAVADAGISGVTFHDLRGTFITLSHRAGASIRDIAEASGHDENECERIIRHHYLAEGAEQVISTLSSNKQFAPAQWMAASEHGWTRVTGPRYARSKAQGASQGSYLPSEP